MTPFLPGSLPHLLVVLPGTITQVNYLHCPQMLSIVKVEGRSQERLGQNCQKPVPSPGHGEGEKWTQMGNFWALGKRRIGNWAESIQLERWETGQDALPASIPTSAPGGSSSPGLAGGQRWHPPPQPHHTHLHTPVLQPPFLLC